MTDPAKIEWTKLIGGSSYDFSQSIITDGKGGLFVSGTAGGSINGQTNNGFTDGFLANYNGKGEEIWTQLLGTNGFDDVKSLVSDGKGGLFVSGTTQGSLNGQINNGGSSGYLANYNASGGEEWTKLIGGDAVRSSSVNGNGGIFVYGVTSGDLNGQVSNGWIDGFLANYNSIGGEIWTKLIGTSSYEDVYAVIPDGNGGVFVTGATHGNLNGQTNNGGMDGFIAKYDSNGDEVWTSLIGGSEYDWAKSIAPDGNGGVLVSEVDWFF